MKMVVTEISVATILLHRLQTKKISNRKLFRRRRNARRMLMAISLLQRSRSKNAKFPKWRKKLNQKNLKRKKILNQSHRKKKSQKNRRVSNL